MAESPSASATTVYKGIKNIEYLNLLASEPIAVTVGTAASAKTWHLHKDLLIKSSPFFAAALNGFFAEAKSKVVNLPEDNTDAFALFIQWLYVGEIAPDDCTADHHHVDIDVATSCHESTFRTLIQAWILGDKLGSSIFKDLAMLGLAKRSADVVMATDIVRAAHERSAPGSKLREFILDLVARDCVVNFGEDLARGTLFENTDMVKYPYEQRSKYLEVLTVEDT